MEQGADSSSAFGVKCVGVNSREELFGIIEAYSFARRFLTASRRQISPWLKDSAGPYKETKVQEEIEEAWLSQNHWHET